MISMLNRRNQRTSSAETVELISQLVGVDIEIIKELIEEFGSIENACRNVTCRRKITPKKAYKLHLLGEILRRYSS